MKLEEAKSKYPGEWIAFVPFEEGSNPEGEVIFHIKDRHLFDKKILECDLGKLGDIYITFAGPSIPEGYAAMF
ncbi:MAG: hypothetical protein AB1556_00495 [Bacillota bacterium]